MARLDSTVTFSTWTISACQASQRLSDHDCFFSSLAGPACRMISSQPSEPAARWRPSTSALTTSRPLGAAADATAGQRRRAAKNRCDVQGRVRVLRMLSLATRGRVPSLLSLLPSSHSASSCRWFGRSTRSGPLLSTSSLFVLVSESASVLSAMLASLLALVCLLASVVPLAFAHSPSLSTVELDKRQGDCPTGVHIIVARASGEAPGEGARHRCTSRRSGNENTLTCLLGTGIIGAVATQVKRAIPGSDSEAIDYPATLANYQSSQSQGVAAMDAAIDTFAQRCSDSKMVLMGYSQVCDRCERALRARVDLPCSRTQQGAHVIGDVICGSPTFGTRAGSSGFGFVRRSKRSVSSALSHAKRQLASPAASQIAAIIQMGDPAFVAGEPFDVGSSRKNGIFPRRDTSCFEPFASRMQSFCDQGDTFCASASCFSLLSGVNVLTTCTWPE